MTTRPGYNTHRLARLMRAAVERCDLDLGGRVVLTEAATGAYLATPVLAAMAGAARVYALTRSTRYGSVEDVAAATLALANHAGVADRIEIVTEKTPALVGAADIITNSGHVRPIDARLIGWMKPTAVVPLMYEAWEYRSEDVDLDACRARGIPVAGTNERHPAVDVFSYLGPMAVKLLLDAGVAVYGSQVLLLCDNDFRPFIERGLRGLGAAVESRCRLDEAAGADYDAVLVALHPRSTPVLTAADAADIARRWPGAILAQYWGDIDGEGCRAAGVRVWPEPAPDAGHMAILPSSIGPEAIVRLQAGGLRVGQTLLLPAGAASTADLAYAQPL